MSGKLEKKHQVDTEKYDYFGVGKELPRLINATSLFDCLIAVPKGKVNLIEIPDEELTEHEKIFGMTMAGNVEDLNELGLKFQQTKIGRKFWQYKKDGKWCLIMGVYVVGLGNRDESIKKL